MTSGPVLVCSTLFAEMYPQRMKTISCCVTKYEMYEMTSFLDPRGLRSVFLV